MDPELAYQGHLIPLEPYVPNIDQIFEKRVKNSLSESAKGEEIESWNSIFNHLSSTEDGFHYALPLFVNLHGKLQPTQSTKESSLPERYEEIESFKNVSIQTSHSACCVYELYAHFAFRGALPLRISYQNHSLSEYKIEHIEFDSAESKKAFGDLLIRIVLNGAKEARDFSIDHDREISLLNSVFKRDVCFNSELYKPLRDFTKRKWLLSMPFESQINNFENTPVTNYLTSLGGYGLAISRQAINIQRAIDFALDIFNCVEIINEDTQKILPPIPTSEINSFLAYHCRPRIPFWSHIEELISMAVKAIYDEIPIDKYEPSMQYTKIESGFYTWIQTDKKADSILKRLNKSVELTFRNNGWKIAYSGVHSDATPGK